MIHNSGSMHVEHGKVRLCACIERSSKWVAEKFATLDDCQLPRRQFQLLNTLVRELPGSEKAAIS